MGSLVRRSAMTRAKRTGLRRNLAVALGNSGTEEAAAVLAEREIADLSLDAPSLEDPMVAEHVDWARRQLRERRRDDKATDDP
jgi:epoxyqueuosine reductase QueG